MNKTGIIGHKKVMSFLEELLKKKTLPQFIILHGEEGLGKTTIANLIAKSLLCESNEGFYCGKCNKCKSNNENSISYYKLALEGGKDIAIEMTKKLTEKKLGNDPVVVIGDEAHRMSEYAQDVFLCDCETLPENRYLILCTTSLDGMSKSLLSRAIKIRLERLSQREIILLAQTWLEENRLAIANPKISLNLLAGACEQKPRTCINILRGCETVNGIISEESLVDALYPENLDALAGILASIGKDYKTALLTASNLHVTEDTRKYLIDLAVCKIKELNNVMFLPLCKVRIPDRQEDVLLEFLEEITSTNRFSRANLINAILRTSEKDIKKNSGDMFRGVETKIEAPSYLDLGNEGATTTQSKLPSIEQLLKEGEIVE